MNTLNFESTLAPWFERFVELKRASGATYNGPAGTLRQFDRYLSKHARRPADVDAQLVGDYVVSTSHLTPRSRTNIVSVVWPALEYAIQHGAPCEPIPLRPAFRRTPACVPVIFSDSQIVQLLTAARKLPLKDRLAPHTYATLFGLLTATGIRVGEARKIELRDLQPPRATLLIREGKFRKSRLLPLHESTIAALNRYLWRRRKAGMPCGPESPLFPNQRGHILVYETIRQTFHHLCESTGIFAETGRYPRIHDLRHSFAVRNVIVWYRAGIDVNTRLRALSTYMGHVSVEKTLVYLRPHEALLVEAARRFEAACLPTYTLSKKEAMP